MLKLNPLLSPAWLTPEHYRQAMETHTNTHMYCCDWRKVNLVACVCFEGLGLCVCVALDLCVCVSSCWTIRGSLLHCCTTNRWPLPYCKKLNTRQGPLSFSEAKPRPYHNTIISVLSLTSIMKYCECFPLNSKKDKFIAARYLWADTALEWFRGLFPGKTLPQPQSCQENCIAEMGLKGLSPFKSSCSSLWSDRNSWVKLSFVLFWDLAAYNGERGEERGSKGDGKRKIEQWEVNTSFLNSFALKSCN